MDYKFLFAYEPTGISLATKMIRDALTRQQPKETPQTLQPVRNKLTSKTTILKMTTTWIQEKTTQDKAMICDALKQYAREQSRWMKSCTHYCADLNLEIPFHQQSWS